eukprot:gene12958-14288_t
MSDNEILDAQYSLLIDKQPIVCADGLMMKCSIIENSYVPEQMINLEAFIASIKRATEVLKTPDSSPNLCRRNKEDSLSRYRSLSMSLGDSGSSPSSSPTLKRSNNSPAFTHNRSRSSSFKSGKSSPQSILLKAALKPKELDQTTSADGSDALMLSEEERCLKEKYVAQIRDLNEPDTDYVYMETLHSVTEASAILEAILDNKLPTVIDLEISSENNMTLCYQTISDFKQDFMMLRIKSDYCTLGKKKLTMAGTKDISSYLK